MSFEDQLAVADSFTALSNPWIAHIATVPPAALAACRGDFDLIETSAISDDFDVDAYWTLQRALLDVLSAFTPLSGPEL